VAPSPIGGQSAISGVFQGIILELILVSILSNGLDSGVDCSLSILAGDTKLGGADDTPNGCTTIQKYLERLEKWADRNLTKFYE